MNRMRRRKKAMSEMNVVPYIDVMLVLLIIFMVTVPIMHQGVDVDAPDISAETISSAGQQAPVIISVDETGQYFLGDDRDPVSMDAVKTYAQQELSGSKQRQVFLRADGSVEYRYLAGAMVALQNAGAKKVSLMTDPTATVETP